MPPNTAFHLNPGKLRRRIHLLGDFLLVANEGGVRQAADKAHLSQSAMTRRIQDLEHELGVALFERTSRGMTLTTFGEALKHHAQLIDLNCAYAVGEINDLLEGGGGELRIAAGPAWAYLLVPDAIAALQQEFPRIRVTLLSRMNEATLPMLSAGQLDVVIGGLPEPAERDPQLRYEPAMEIDQLVFSGRGHPLQKRKRVAPKDLYMYPWVWFAEAVMGRDMLARYFRGAGIEPPPSAVETTSVQSGFRLMQRADYLMLLPSTLGSVAAEYGLRQLPGLGSLGRYTAGLMYRESVLRLRAFAVFRDLLLGQAGQSGSRKSRLLPSVRGAGHHE